MKITTMESEKPDIIIQLNAEEATVLCRYFGELSNTDIEETMDKSVFGKDGDSTVMQVLSDVIYSHLDEKGYN